MLFCLSCCQISSVLNGIIGARKMADDLYFGRRVGDSKNVYKGKMACMSLLACPISKDQIAELKKELKKRCKGELANGLSIGIKDLQINSICSLLLMTRVTFRI